MNVESAYNVSASRVMSFPRLDTTRSLAIAVTTGAIYRSSRERTLPRAPAKAYLPCLIQKESLHRNSEGMSENRCPASTDQVDSSDVIRARGGVHDLSRSVRSAVSVQNHHLQMSTQHLPAYCRVSSAGKARYCGRPSNLGDVDVGAKTNLAATSALETEDQTSVAALGPEALSQPTQCGRGGSRHGREHWGDGIFGSRGTVAPILDALMIGTAA